MCDGHIEAAQQSKARKKTDFLIAFSSVIAEAAATAYRGATNEVQQKLRRVIGVWRERHIFEIAIQEAIEARIDSMWSSTYLITILTKEQSLT
jgi:regulator of Ty1 transposition protein 103